MKRYLEESGGEVGEVEQFRVMQKELLNEEQGLGMPWKVSDLITVGSPLTYADYLLVDRRYPLERRRQDRELPTCPPQLEDDRDIGFLSPTYRTKDGIVERKHLLHHAALFACTRWTNIYFKSDIIGGSLIPVLGTGIKDVSLGGDTDAGKGLAAHVMYWDSREKAACAALKDAMGLCELKEISHG